jgi:hypothetical protein
MPHAPLTWLRRTLAEIWDSGQGGLQLGIVVEISMGGDGLEGQGMDVYSWGVYRG